VASQAFSMEIHFVHKHLTFSCLAVVGVLVAPGNHKLATLEIWDNLPKKPTQHLIIRKPSSMVAICYL
ncbi:MAG: hypothetical protein QMC11_10220, partial [Rhodospirillales bacterium]